jgi:glycosyltransferase involved in cell wall biosynthesis
MKRHFLVSVVIPAYNAEDCVSRAIRSVLQQTIAPHEILVIDDGSTDHTRVVAGRFGNPVRVLSQRHAGAAQARNIGIRVSAGDIIAFLDADDEWLNVKLEKQLALHDGRSIALSYCRSNEFDILGNDLGDTFNARPLQRGTGVWRDLLCANFIATPTVMADRALLMAVGGFDVTLKVGEDQDLWIKLALRGFVDFIDESLVRVHQRADSLSSSGFRDQICVTLPMIWKHMEMLKPRLTAQDVRAIRATRMGQVGRNAYAHGEVRMGLPLMAQAIRSGDGLFRNLYHLAAASRPIGKLRAATRHRHTIYTTGKNSTPASAGPEAR